MSTNHIPDRIRLTGVSARGYHGVLPFERSEGQLFSVDITADLGERGTAVAAVTDSLTDALDYGAVARAVAAVIEGEPVNLIETLAERIADATLAFSRVKAVEVTVHKPQAPLDVAFDDVAVTIARSVDSPALDAGRPSRRSEEPVAASSPVSAGPAAHSFASGPSSWGGPASPQAVPSPAPAEPAAPSLTSESSAWETSASPLAAPSPLAASSSFSAPASPAYGEPASAGSVPSADPLAAAPGLGEPAPSAPVFGGPAAPIQAESVPSATPMAAAPGFGEPAPSTPGFGEPLAPAQPQPLSSAAPVTSTPGFPGGAPMAAGGFDAAAGGGQPFQQPAPIDPLSQRPTSPAAVVIALGGNVGGVVSALRLAVGALYETEGMNITAVAPLARTAAVLPEGVPAQPDFLNTVVLAETTLSPREVLEVCTALETDAGRVRSEPYAPRTLDADVIAFEGVTASSPDLTLPHPRAAERAFVLVPWAQADPFAELGSQSVSSLAEVAPDRDGVRWLALDWLDSDHLPALPTGQYVEPPVPAEPQPADPGPVHEPQAVASDEAFSQPYAGTPAPAGFAGSPASAGFAGTPAPAGFAGSPASAGFAGTPAPAGFAGSPASAGFAGTPAPAGFAGSPASAGFAGTPAPAGPGGAPYEPQAPYEPYAGTPAPAGFAGSPASAGIAGTPAPAGYSEAPYGQQPGASTPEPGHYALPEPAAVEDADWRTQLNWNDVIGRNNGQGS